MMVVPKGLENVLQIDQEIMHGKLCFAGTRIPLTIFLDNYKDGMSLEDFLINYPSIELHQLHSVLNWEDKAIREAAGIQIAV